MHILGKRSFRSITLQNFVDLSGSFVDFENLRRRNFISKDLVNFKSSDINQLFEPKKNFMSLSFEEKEKNMLISDAINYLDFVRTLFLSQFFFLLALVFVLYYVLKKNQIILMLDTLFFFDYVYNFEDVLKYIKSFFS